MTAFEIAVVVIVVAALLLLARYEHYAERDRLAKEADERARLRLRQRD